MKNISVLFFCAFISYSFSGKRNVALVHQQTGVYVSLSAVSYSDRIKRRGRCTKGPCNGPRPRLRRPCCAGYICECENRKCYCSSQNRIHVATNGIVQTVIAFLIFIVNLPSY
ncbi:uncharacterized protein LOC128250536 isoform X2 [Octopus bimaculoides]|nr:uncharacterized protein LOC128250536 isoform X2 [Octopus bimaculoides]